MQKKLINTITILSIMGLVIGYAWFFDSCFEGQMEYNREIQRREYIKFQRDSLELELMKKNIK
jgi:hypothetical protein